MRLLRLLTVLGVLALSLARPGHALTPTDIGKAGETDLASAIEYVEDPTGSLRIDDLLQAGREWQANQRHTFNQGYNDSTWWLRVRIRNPGTNEANLLFEVGYAVLDYLDVYVVDNGQILQTYNLGDKLPHYSRPVDHRFFAVPLTWQPQQSLDIYVRVQSGSSIQAPLTLWSYERFYSADTASTIVQGIYYGGMLVIAIYNLLIYLVLRSRSYLYYVGFVISMPMFLAAMSGQSFRYLWPDATRWNDQAIVFFLGLTLTCGSIFTRRFLRIIDISRPLALGLNAIAAASFINALMAFFVPYHLCIQGLVLLGILGASTGLGAGIYALLRQQTSARIYVVAWFSFLVGAAILELNKLGILPNNLFTEYATQFGSMIEVVLLSFALAERINVERRLRFEAQTETLLATRKLNEELEQRVAERTSELEKLNQRLQELSDTDQLTGLKNRRYLEQRLKEEWARAVRQQHSLAVVMIDIDHFKSINDSHGHPVGDACLQQVAGLISQGLRWPSDIAARYGGEEFCLLLPQTTLDGAFSVIERVRSRIAEALIETSTATFRVTISAGVYAAVPQRADNAESFVSKADSALYRAKQDGRNRVAQAN